MNKESRNILTIKTFNMLRKQITVRIRQVNNLFLIPSIDAISFKLRIIALVTILDLQQKVGQILQDL